jgi:hypothetical protein
MTSRRPLVLVSGFTSELPDGDSVIGISAGTVTAGSGLVNGGDVSSDIRLDVQLSPNPSGLIYIGTGDAATLGIDGAAQVAAESALSSGNAALVDASQALASGNAALVDASTALASGNAALADSSEALASGNAALSSADSRLLRAGDTATGQIRFIAGNNNNPGIGVGDTNTGFYLSATDELSITAGGSQVFKIDASGVASFTSTRGVDLPQGDDSQRPAGNNGITRYNTVASGLEVYTPHPINWQPLASLERVQLFQRAQRGVVSGVGLVSGTVTLDFNKANNFSMILGGTTTINTPNDLKEGQSGVIYIQQDSVGSRTASYASEWDFPNGSTPTLTTVASGVDVLCYATRTSSNIAANLLNNLS